MVDKHRYYTNGFKVEVVIWNSREYSNKSGSSRGQDELLCFHELVVVDAILGQLLMCPNLNNRALRHDHNLVSTLEEGWGTSDDEL